MKKVPAATIRGTYSTYENSKQRDLVKRLGHVVDLRLEGLAMIELGNWMSGLKIICPRNVRITTTIKKDGSAELFLSV